MIIHPSKGCVWGFVGWFVAFVVSKLCRASQDALSDVVWVAFVGCSVHVICRMIQRDL